MGGQVIQLAPGFPFLFGGTFIEGARLSGLSLRQAYFPSFSEGLSLRVLPARSGAEPGEDCPSFSEGLSLRGIRRYHRR